MPEWTLPSESASVPLARRVATNSLPGLPATVLADVALVVSELATNCVRHAHTDFHLRVERHVDEVRVEVTDGGRGDPRPQTPEASQPHGRGLHIVQVVARQWGVVPAGSGKTVWCTIALLPALSSQ
jgi:anti-sigma regulatory factor (Ser/Thr protein kinase)